jgi:hypothetical protein
LSDAQTILKVVLMTDQKGAVAELSIARAAAECGIGVYKPLTDGERSDLIFEVESRLYRVQCKYARVFGDVIRVRCYSTRRAKDGLRKRVYRVEEVDLIAAYCPDLDRCFLLGGSEFDERTQVDLRLGDCRNSQMGRVNNASAFEFAAKLTALLGP